MTIDGTRQAAAHRHQRDFEDRTIERLRLIAGKLDPQGGGLGLDEAGHKVVADLRFRVLKMDNEGWVRDYAFKLVGALRGGNQDARRAAAAICAALQMELPLGLDLREADPEPSSSPEEASEALEEGAGGSSSTHSLPPGHAEADRAIELQAAAAESATPQGIILVGIDKLRVEEPFRSLFPIRPETVEAIARDMLVRGFDAAHPLIAWAGHGIVIDGHTRLEAARRAGLAEVYILFRDFPDKDAALAFALHEQRDRRNLTDADFVRLVETLDEYRARGGDRRSEEARSKTSNDVFGPSSTATAKLIGTSPTKVEKARAVNAAADPSLRERVETGELSLNRAASQARAAKRPARPRDAAKIAGRAAKALRCAAAGLRELGEPFAGLCAQIDELAEAVDAAAGKAADPETGGSPAAGAGHVPEAQGRQRFHFGTGRKLQ